MGKLTHVLSELTYYHRSFDDSVRILDLHTRLHKDWGNIYWWGDFGMPLDIFWEIDPWN